MIHIPKEKQEIEKKRKPWLVIILVLLFLSLISIFIIGIVALLVTDESSLTTGNVAVIPIKGVILIDGEQSLFSSTGIAASNDIVEQIKKAEKDPMIQAIIFDINSPGGAPVASAEIARAIKEAKKPTVAVIREVGASGAYWAASATDHIIANEVSITGSIGVLASYIEFSGLMERYNVSYERFVAGEHKDMGSPYREMTEEEKKIYQQVLDQMYDVFVTAVAENRNLDKAYVEELATGQIYLGLQAVDNGLVDQLGGKEEAYAYLAEKLQITVQPVVYEKEKSFFEMLASTMDQTGYQMGVGLGETLKEEESAEVMV